jgi:NADH dehydrogenase (ubiquinone) Fe-S protein 1
MRGK